MTSQGLLSLLRLPPRPIASLIHASVLAVSVLAARVLAAGVLAAGVLAAGVLAGPASATSLAEVAADPWQGRWTLTVLDSVGSFDEGRCGLLEFTEHTLHLAPLAGGGYNGWKTRVTHRRITFAGGEGCRLEGAAHPFAEGRIEAWQMELEPLADGEGQRVAGHSGQCLNDGCAEAWTPEREIFDTVFRLDDGRLVDTRGTESSADDLYFLPQVESHERAAHATEAGLEIVHLLTGGRCEEVRSRAHPSAQSALSDAAMTPLCGQWSGLEILTRSLGEVHLAAAPEDTESQDAYAIVIHKINTPRGGGTETLVLRRDRDTYKLFYLALAL